MPNISDLTGTPWHPERMHRAEGDARRYKTKCKHYEHYGEHCNFYNERCRGSAHCVYYEEYRKSGIPAPSLSISKPTSPQTETSKETTAERTWNKADEAYILSCFQPGTKVVHELYGDGIILTRNDATLRLTIQFFSPEKVREMDLKIMIEKRKISIKIE